MKKVMKTVAVLMLTMTVMCTVGCSKSDDSDNYVDLGLPSGLLWATHNVGADSPEDYGSHFSWGETTTKSAYNWSTYKYGNEVDTSPYYHLTKYNTISDYGPIDNLTSLQSGDDVATTDWGKNARIPTMEEWRELSEHCTFEWTTLNGVNGTCFTGPNGNTLFLPAGGSCWNDQLYYAENYGYYWSSSLDTYHPEYAWGFHFYSGFASVIDGYRGHAFLVRPVRKR